jgi:hypothetical protein
MWSAFCAGVIRVNVPNLAQVPNWRSLVKTSLELQSCPLFQINRRPKNPLGLLPLVKSINLKEGTRLQLQRCFYQTASIWDLRQIWHIYPIEWSTQLLACSLINVFIPV